MMAFLVININANYAYPPLLGDSFKGYDQFMQTNRCIDCYIPGISIMVETRPHSNLRGTTMYNSEIVLAVLNNSDISYANLENAWMYAAHVSITDLSYSNMTNLQASNAFFVNDNFDHAILDNARFFLAEMSKSRFNYTSIIGANFIHAGLTLTEFNKSNLTGSLLNGCDFGGAKVLDCLLDDTSMKKVKARHSDFSGTSFLRSKLYSADFMRSNLTNTNFNEALMYKFIGSHSNFTNANLQHAELIDAELRFCNLKGTKTDNTNFTGAILIGSTNFNPAESAILCQTIMPDGSVNNSGCHRLDQYIEDLVAIENLESKTKGYALNIRPYSTARQDAGDIGPQQEAGDTGLPPFVYKKATPVSTKPDSTTKTTGT